MSSFTGVVIFERTDFDNEVGNRFDSDPMVFLTEPSLTYSTARHAAATKAQECLRNGAMVQEEMGNDTRSMLAAADRIFVYNNATYSFTLPAGNKGEFLVRWQVVQND